MASNKKFATVDRFFGMNEAIDGETELRSGEASRCENWYITDGMNLETRPGIRQLTFEGRTPGEVIAAWSGHVGTLDFLCLVDFLDGQDRIFLFTPTDTGKRLYKAQYGALGLTDTEGANVKLFAFAGTLYIMSSSATLRWDGERFAPAQFYIPRVVTAAPPSGGGTILEPVNLLSPKRRIDYSSDGEATEYRLPLESASVDWVLVDNEPAEGSFDPVTHVYTFLSAPPKGVGNVEIQYSVDQSETEQNYSMLASCRLSETFNGASDTRLFLAGDGTNRLYYTGVPYDGDLTQLYFPAMSEIAVDMSASPVTGMIRHYGKLLVFKPDGAFTVTYDTIYLADGSAAAGFRLQPANREYGSDIYGQIQTVDNFPRTITKGGIYEWNITASYYRDERYAKRVSEKVMHTLGKADVEKIITCDDNYSHTYYVFLGDSEGTVLVNRYSIVRGGVWFIYKSRALRYARFALMHGGAMTVITADGNISFFDRHYAYDQYDGQAYPILARWESGYNPFGIDYRRKSSGLIYVSCIPRGASSLKITAMTDRKSGEEAYNTKEISNSLFSFSTLRFSTLRFNASEVPHINRVKLKVKKFVYYKLVFLADEPGAQASVLSYDLEIRLSGMAK